MDRQLGYRLGFAGQSPRSHEAPRAVDVVSAQAAAAGQTVVEYARDAAIAARAAYEARHGGNEGLDDAAVAAEVQAIGALSLADVNAPVS